ncbi:hypothetical protein vseg_000972 [Gypsophila vaccaria]
MSRYVPRSSSSKDRNKGKLLHETVTISDPHYFNKSVSTNTSPLSRIRSKPVDEGDVHNSKSKHVSDDQATKGKKSLWNWGPLKALSHHSHVKHRRFNCSFNLEVHRIEELPTKFNSVELRVHWETKGGEAVTKAVKVIRGVAEFKEILTHTCSIHGSRYGSRHPVKYDVKHFLLYVEVLGKPKLDIGKHNFDLTRLLPLTLEELDDGKSSGTWATSFKLSGEAKGANMSVTFRYVVLPDGTPQNNKNVLQLLGPRTLAINSVKFDQRDARRVSLMSMDDVKTLHDCSSRSMTDFSDAVNILYQKLNEEQTDSPVDVKHEIVFPAEDSEPVKCSDGSPSAPSKGHSLNDCEDAELSFAEKGSNLENNAELDVKYRTEFSTDDAVHEPLKPSESSPSNLYVVNESEEAESSSTIIGLDAEEQTELEEKGTNVIDKQDEKSPEHPGVNDDVEDTSYEEGNAVGNEEIHDSNAKVKDVCTKESLLEDLESVLGHVDELEKDGMDTPDTGSEIGDQDNQNTEEPTEVSPSHSSDNLGNIESLNTLEIDKFSLSFNSEVESPRERLLRAFFKEIEATGCSLIGSDIDEDDAMEEFSDDSDSLPADQLEYPKIRARVVEDPEPQELPEEWGPDEKAFIRSSPRSISSLGSPVYLPPNATSLPPIGEGLGPFIQTKTGGYLRSMKPDLFSNADNGGSLIMQVSSPVVIPAKLGSDLMDVLQKLASVGLEKLSSEAKRIMPLEDITGTTIQQMAWDAMPNPEAESSKRQNLMQNEQEASSIDSEFASLEDLVPLAMNKIEELSIEGLRIQSGMSNEEAPSNITARSIGEFSASEGKRVGSPSSVGLEGFAGLQLLDIKDTKTNSRDVDELIGLSLTLDEWMKLDSGDIDEDQPSDRISKLLAAHRVNPTDLNFRCGLLGNNFKVALMVQLRDPLRNYEPVGTPMLSLIQVERRFSPPKPSTHAVVAESMDSNEEEDDVLEPVSRGEGSREHDLIPEFKICEVHVAGIETEPGKKRPWGNAAQQQSGSRWLVANGMGKSNRKNPVMRPKIVSKYPLPATITSRPGDTLWSISVRCCGNGAKWKELAALNPHIRNPNVILYNETIKLR